MNVLFITLDQFRGDCLSAAGHPVVRTPGLDELAVQGVRFARHYSQAAPCAPGRAALYTGTYQMNNRVVTNGTPLDDRFDNVARVAQRAGFDPTLFGYTDQAVDPRTVTDPDDPRLLTYEGVLPGFTSALDLTGSLGAWREWVGEQGFDIPVDAAGALSTELGRPSEVGISAFLTDRFLDWHTRCDRPWFAHLSYLRPHPPYAAAGEWSTVYSPDDVDLPIPAGPVDELHRLHRMLLALPFAAAPTDEGAIRRMRAQYYGMIGDVDHQLERVWAALRERGQWDDTLIVITSDHGDQLGDHGLIDKFGWFESSFHVVGIVRDPSRPGVHGAVVDRFTENVDVLPTICDALGVDVPRQCDGVSLCALLDGDEPERWRDAAHWEFDWRVFALMSGRSSGWPSDRRLERRQVTVLRGEDRAYAQFADGEALTYALSVDPTWRTAVVDPEAAWADARALLGWRAEHADRILTDTLIGPPNA